MCDILSGEDGKEKIASEDDRSFSSDDNVGDDNDESRYRITLPLDAKLPPPAPVFAAPPLLAIPHPSMPHPSLPVTHLPLHAPLPSHPTVHSSQLAVQQSVQPLMTASVQHSADVLSLPPVNHPLPSLLPSTAHHHQQQPQPLMLPPVQLLHQPRCRDYDGESILACLKNSTDSVNANVVIRSLRKSHKLVLYETNNYDKCYFLKIIQNN